MAGLACVVLAYIGVAEWLAIPVYALSSLVMLEFNRINVLLRVRSRMVSTVFIVLTFALGYVISSAEIALLQLCFALTIFLVSQTYQDRSASGYTYYAFAALGVASIFFPGVLWLGLVMCILLFQPLYSLSIRTFNAAVMGILTPYLFLGVYTIYANDYSRLEEFYTSFLDYKVVFDYSGVTIGMIVNYAVMLLLTILGTTHFVRKAYLDKIRTRIFYDVFIAIAWVILVLAAIVPCYMPQLLSVVCVVTAPLIAHYITLTSTKLTNISFFVLSAIILLLSLFNQCLTSLSHTVLLACL